MARRQTRPSGPRSTRVPREPNRPPLQEYAATRVVGQIDLDTEHRLRHGRPDDNLNPNGGQGRGELIESKCAGEPDDPSDTWSDSSNVYSIGNLGQIACPALPAPTTIGSASPIRESAKWRRM